MMNEEQSLINELTIFCWNSIHWNCTNKTACKCDCHKTNEYDVVIAKHLPYPNKVLLSMFLNPNNPRAFKFTEDLKKWLVEYRQKEEKELE